MTATMMSRFIESGFAPIEIDGELVHPMYTVALRAGDRVRLRWISSDSPRVQGVTLRLRVPGVSGRKGEGGRLRVDEVEAPAIVLWMDSAPAVVDAECVEALEGAVLQVSNRWRLPDGREDEWLNNYGMRIQEVEPNAVMLHCSDGYGSEPSFDDLVVRLDVVRKNACAKPGKADSENSF